VFWKISLRGIPRELVRTIFCTTLWRFLLALDGPTNNILFLKDSVKDILLYNCG
jgi:hypothetical protein